MQHNLSPTTVWTPVARGLPKPYASLPWLLAMRRGAACRCPACGRTKLFEHWLRQAPSCAACQAPLGMIHADDAPPYFTIFIVAHVMIGVQIAFERVALLSVTAELAIFVPLALALTFALMRPVKGATIALMLKLGFAAPEAAADAAAADHHA